MTELTIWRHPRPHGVDGLCLGRTDVVVDRRKSKRLAHRIRSWARRHDRPHAIFTSPLRRAADVGRWLARWGWTHRVDARLAEMDFGEWDGRSWSDIPVADIDAWCADFVAGTPGGGESLSRLLDRAVAFSAEHRGPAISVVGHAGWISAMVWLEESPGRLPDPASWPRAVGYGARVVIAPMMSG